MSNSDSKPPGSGKWWTITVVTGLPACGKTKIAESIAWCFSCNLISLGNILQGLQTAHESQPLPSCQQVKDLTDTGIRILISQVASGLDRMEEYGKVSEFSEQHIVVNLPAAYVLELERFIDEWCTNHEKVVHMILIICRPRDKRQWQMVFNQALSSTSNVVNWFKPKSWDEIQKAIKQDEEQDVLMRRYNSDDEKEIINNYRAHTSWKSSITSFPGGKDRSTHVSTVLIDPFTCEKPSTKFSMSVDGFQWIVALGYLIFQRDLDSNGPCCMKFAPRFEHGNFNPADSCIYDDHELVLYKPSKQKLTHISCCCVCKKQMEVDSANYYCTSCPQGIDQDCMECMFITSAAQHWDDKSYCQRICGPRKKGKPISTSGEPKVYPGDSGKMLSLSSTERRLAQMFQRLHSCQPDEHKHRRCNRCKSCLFWGSLNTGNWAGSVFHPLHQHILRIRYIQKYNFVVPISCAACGQHMLNEEVAYCCLRCNSYYMQSCLYLPLEIANDHIGYNQHAMQLTFSPHADGDDGEEPTNYICHVCWEERDTQLWYYYCDDCDYSAHINCVFPLNVRHTK